MTCWSLSSYSLPSPRRIAALAPAALLAGCVFTSPGQVQNSGPPTIELGEPRGQALAANDRLVFMTAGYAAEAGKATGTPAASRPQVEDFSAIADSFVGGFRSVVASGDLRRAGAELDTVCRPLSDETSPGGTAQLSAACRNALAALGARYLLRVSAWHTTAEEASGGSMGTRLPTAGVTTRRSTHWEVNATVFAAASGEPVCSDRGFQFAIESSSVGVLLIPGLYPPIPVPYARVEDVDKAALLKRAAWIAGARAASCFMPRPAKPAAEAAPPEEAQP